MINAKYLYFDLDGTIIPDEISLSNQTLNAINYLKTKDIKVGICTGRSWFITSMYASLLQVDLPTICLDGCWILDVDQNPLKADFINQNNQKAILNYFINHNISFLAMTNDGVYSNNNFFSMYVWFLNLVKKIKANHLKQLNYNLKMISNYDSFLKQNWFKLHVQIDNQKQKNDLLNFLSQLKDLLFYVTPRNTIAVFKANTSKANGIKYVLNKLHLDKDLVAVFGDDINDISMLSYFKNSISLPNAINEAKQVAKYITKKDCFHNGVAEFIFENF